MPSQPPTLAALFETEETGLLRFAIGLVGRRSVAEELVQETFLRLHQLWSQVEIPEWRTVSCGVSRIGSARTGKPSSAA